MFTKSRLSPFCEHTNHGAHDSTIKQPITSWVGIFWSAISSLFTVLLTGVKMKAYTLYYRLQTRMYSFIRCRRDRARQPINVWVTDQMDDWSGQPRFWFIIISLVEDWRDQRVGEKRETDWCYPELIDNLTAKWWMFHSTLSHLSCFFIFLFLKGGGGCCVWSLKDELLRNLILEYCIS